MKLSFHLQIACVGKESYLFIREWLQGRTLIPNEIGFVLFMNYPNMGVLDATKRKM